MFVALGEHSAPNGAENLWGDAGYKYLAPNGAKPISHTPRSQNRTPHGHRTDHIAISLR